MGEVNINLYHRIQENDKHALEQLYMKYEKLLYSFSYRLSGDSELAEEIVQDVFMKIWTKKGIYNDKRGKFSSWLLTVTRNTAIDMMRKRKMPIYTLEEQDDIHNNEPSTEDLIEWKEENARLKEAILNLKSEQQEIVELFYFKGLSQQKIADKYKIPLGTVKGRVRLALKHLKRTLSITSERKV